MDFTALDFETANSFRGSPCSVGLARVRDGSVVETAHWLMQPPPGFREFDPWNVCIHGITPDMVAGQPGFDARLPQMVDFVGADMVVMHNAGFDAGVLRYACQASGVGTPAWTVFCTLVMSRRALSLPTYSLPYVAASLGISFTDHHRADADATAAGLIAVSLLRSAGHRDLPALADALRVAPGRLESSIWRGCHALPALGQHHRLSAEVNPNADPAHYLYGQTMVFTGTLPLGMTRQQAWDAVARLGATPESNVTKRTNILVVGELDPARLRPGEKLSGKANKAVQLQEGGQQIEIMTGQEFLSHLDSY